MSHARRWTGRWSARAASAWLGGAVLALAAVESVWSGGLEPLLPHAAILTATHWTIGSILVIGAFADPASVRVFLIGAGALVCAAGVAGLVFADAIGDTLGLSGVLPTPAAALHVVLGVAAAAASFLPAEH